MIFGNILSAAALPRFAAEDAVNSKSNVTAN